MPALKSHEIGTTGLGPNSTSQAADGSVVTADRFTRPNRLEVTRPRLALLGWGNHLLVR